MSRLLSFAAGISIAVVGMVVFNTNHQIFSWVAGMLIGSWVTGIGMIWFWWVVGTDNGDRPQKVIELDKSYIIEDDDEDIYEDPDWWKDDKKRQKHRDRLNGLH